MVGWSGSISLVVGLTLGMIITMVKPGALFDNKPIHWVLDKGVNFFRSIPFIILMAGLMPLSRRIMGTGIGVPGAIIPLVFGAVPFYSRQVEAALAEVDRGLIEAALSMGTSRLGIIFRIYLPEGLPGIVRGTTITAISLIGLTAMAGVVGAGGLGDFAIRYGHDRNQPDVIYITIVILVLLVSVLQFVGNYFAEKNTH